VKIYIKTLTVKCEHSTTSPVWLRAWSQSRR